MAELIASRGHLTISELAKHFQVSSPTVRRDLTVLAHAGVAARTHGGVMAPGRAGGIEPLFMEKLRVRQALKARIGRAAAGRIKDGSIVLLDSGTTALSVARALARRKVSIITMDLKAAEAAAEGETKVALVGGQVRNGYYSLVGGWALRAVSDLKCDVFIMAADAIDPNGVSNSTSEEAEVKRAAVASSLRTILVADHSKLNRRDRVSVCSLDAIDLLVTDRKASARIDAYRSLIAEIDLQ